MNLIFLPVKLILTILNRIEDILYLVRDALWSYPKVFSGDNANIIRLQKLYKASVPYSNMALSLFLIILLIIPAFLTGFPKVFSFTGETYSEAVVMGTDELGEIRRLNKINPLLPSNIQLEKDISTLIYEPLVEYTYKPIEKNSDEYVGGVNFKLAESILTIKPGASYQFSLKENIEWHDGEEFNADDVIRTFDILADVGSDEFQRNSNAYTRALQELHWEKIDRFTVLVCTKPVEESEDPCAIENTNPIFSNFLELVSFMIVPEHMSENVNQQTINSNEPELFRSPVGTGKFKIDDISNTSISLTAYENHPSYSEEQDIKRIVFEYYATGNEAASAVENSEVHGFASFSSQFVDEFVNYPQVNSYESPVLYNQFWALYFNLRTDLEGNPIAPAFLQDKSVREAISLSIDKERLIEDGLNEVGEVANGPIPDLSYYYNPDAGWLNYNRERAIKLLEEAGWKLNSETGVRQNENGDQLSFSLYYVNNLDRRRVVENIKSDLAAVGIDVVVDKNKQQTNLENQEDEEFWSLEELNNQILAPRLFDVVLYGMNTFIDPDRFELYHSSQIDYPGLNIAGYVSTEQTVDKNEDREEGESSLINVPKVDRFLEQARSFNPEENREERKDRYDEVQRLIAGDVPVIYLYHPQYTYFINERVTNVNLSNTYTLEERFRNINLWRLN